VERLPPWRSPERGAAQLEGDRKNVGTTGVHPSMGRFASSRDRDGGRPLAAGLVGVGAPGQDLLRALPTEQIEVRWLCDPDPQLLESIGRSHPDARLTEFDRLLEDDELDAVLIAEPAPAQFELALRALAAGKHALLAEPVALSANALARLARFGADEELVLACGHTVLYSSPVQTIKTMLDEREIGELFFASSSRRGAEISAASPTSTMSGGHFATLLHWLDERPQTVRAIAPGHPGSDSNDTTMLTLTFPSGLVANIELEWAMGRTGRTVLVGSERMVVYDEAEEAISTLDHGIVHKDTEDVTDYRISYPIANAIPVAARQEEPLRLALEDFGEAVRSGGEVLAGGSLARDVTRVIEATGESLRKGGTEVPVHVRRRLLRAQPRRRAAQR
jgi:predicted dehydrogenase